MVASFPGDDSSRGTTFEDGTRRVYPCSRAQARFWYEEQVQPGNPARNVFARWRLEGDVSTSELDEAWRMLVARHGTLRTTLTAVDGAPVQVVEAAVDFHVREVDLSLLSESESASRAESIALMEAQKPFALDSAPLLRVTLVRLREGACILMVVAHHTVCDGWSMGILAAEMGEICSALRANRAPNLPELATTYGEYSLRQQPLSLAALAPERDFLKRQFAGYTCFEVPPDKPRPPLQTWNGDIASVLLERTLTDALGALARDSGCTLFIAAYAVLLLVLYRRTGETDIAIGTQAAGRDDVEIENLVGTFVNTIVLRTDLSGDPTFAELLERARDAVMDAFEVRHVPTDLLVQIVNPKRDAARNTFLSVNFVFQRSFIENRAYDGFTLTDLPSRSAGAIFDLCFFMVERVEGWRISCEYNVDLFETPTVLSIIDDIVDSIAAVAADPGRTLSSLAPRQPETPQTSVPSEGAAPVADGASGDERVATAASTTEATLHGYIADLLGYDDFGLDEDIFGCGFHSLLALRLNAKIKESTGIDLPLRSLFDTPTVSELAARLEAMRETKVIPESPVRPDAHLNAGGSRPPFIFLHSDLFADGLYCRRLAAALPQQPICALAPHGTAGLPLLPTIEAMALEYFSRIRSIQPNGPYRVGGFCVSGLVAYELARLLKDAGQTVERVVLVNASALPRRSIPAFDRLLRSVGLNARLSPKRRTALCYNIARLHEALVMGPAAVVRFAGGLVVPLLRRRAAARVAEAEPFVQRRSPRDIENSLAHIVAAFTYHPRPYDGDVDLIWSDEQTTGAEVPAAAWSLLARNVRVVPMAGGHVEPLNETIIDLARALQTALAE